MALGKNASPRTVFWLVAALGCGAIAGNAHRLGGWMTNLVGILAGVGSLFFLVAFLRSYARD